MDVDDARIEDIRATLEPFVGGDVQNKLEGLDLFVQLDYLAYGLAKTLDDYRELTSVLPLSELIKFAMYEGIKNG